MLRNPTGTNDGKMYEFEAHFQSFVQELQSLLALESSGELSQQSVAKIKKLLIDYWRLKT